MKKVLMCSIACLLGVSFCSMLNAADNVSKPNGPADNLTPTTKPAFPNPADELSYAIGLNYGQQIKSGMDQGLIDKPNLKLVIKALEDAVNDKSVMTKEQQDQAMNRLRQEAMARRDKRLKDDLAKAKTFMEENKKKPGIKTTKSGLQYEIIKEGTGPVVKPTDMVKVNYRITVNGKEFGSTYKNKKAEDIPANALPPGWAEGLQLLKIGSKAKLFLPPELSGGERGLGPGMPGNSVVVIEMEVLDFVPTPTPRPSPSLMPNIPMQPGAPK